MSKIKVESLLSMEDTLERLADKKRLIDASIRELTASIDEMRKSILDEMLEDGVLNMVECNRSISVQDNPRGVIVTDETKLPERFIKIVRSVDKKALNEAVKGGEVIEGCSLDNGGKILVFRGVK